MNTWFPVYKHYWVRAHIRQKARLVSWSATATTLSIKTFLIVCITADSIKCDFSWICLSVF